jgi:amidohydrolase
MKPCSSQWLFLALAPFLLLLAWAGAPPALNEAIQSRLNKEFPSLLELYRDLHTHPELSFHEEKTAERVAAELRQAGYEVTTHVGGFGVVGVLRNGAGPTILTRAELDGLPVKEETGLPYASAVTTKDDRGNDVSVMHACGHDVNLTCFIGAARLLAQLKDRWHGTLVAVGQPAEETGRGARAMLSDGLYTRFPLPNFCLSMHDNAQLPAGTIGYTSGYTRASVDSVDVTVRGVGGHGAYPQTTKDPIVLAAQIVLALQTIVSREVEPGEPAVVTVGSIHGGTKHNIIPDEVRLQLTLRSYSDDVRQQTIAAVKRIVRGEAIAAGIPDDRLPTVTLLEEYTPATYNDPATTERVVTALKGWLGEANVVKIKPVMGGEDFSEFGRTSHKIPICDLDIGAVDPRAIEESRKSGKPLPSLHSAYFAPLPDPTIKTGATAMAAAALELLGTKPARSE